MSNKYSSPVFCLIRLVLLVLWYAVFPIIVILGRRKKNFLSTCSSQTSPSFRLLRTFDAKVGVLCRIFSPRTSGSKVFLKKLIYFFASVSRQVTDPTPFAYVSTKCGIFLRPLGAVFFPCFPEKSGIILESVH